MNGNQTEKKKEEKYLAGGEKKTRIYAHVGQHARGKTTTTMINTKAKEARMLLCELEARQSISRAPFFFFVQLD